MKTTNNTILITGGASGIGLATAKLFADHNNRVIIVGRNEQKLLKATKSIPGITAIACDITDEIAVDKLIKQIETEYPELNIIMNNAGKAEIHSLTDNTNTYAIAKAEMEVNFFSAVRLNNKILPLLKNKSEAAIINNSSITAYIPASRLATYSASKAALHSYTQSLRIALQSYTQLQVFEVICPLVDTEFAKDIPGDKIAPELVASAVLDGLHHNQHEILVASAGDLYAYYLKSPQESLKFLNR